MNRGDVVRVDLPPPDGPAGTEQFGTRPAIVVHANGARANLSTVLIVPCTSKRKAIRFDGSVLIQPTTLNGLSFPSVALVSQMRAIDAARVRGSPMGQLSPNDLASIDTQMRRLLDLA